MTENARLDATTASRSGHSDGSTRTDGAVPEEFGERVGHATHGERDDGGG